MTDRRTATLPTGYLLALLASALIGAAIVPAYGAYAEIAVGMLIMGLLLLGLLLREQLRAGGVLRVPASAVLPLLWVAVFGLAWVAPNGPTPLLYAESGGWATGPLVQAAFLLLLLTYLPALLIDRIAEAPAWRTARFAAIGLGIAVVGWDVVRSSPAPLIDVWEMQQAGAQALAGGDNPYEAVAVGNTAPGVTEDLPYVYPPLQVLVTLPAYLLGGDIRYTILVALLAAGFALRFIARRAPAGVDRMPAFAEDAPALFVWFTPTFAFLLEQAWVDPVQLALLCGAVAAYVAGRRRIAAVLLGLTLASKQTAFWLAGLAAYCLRFTRREWLIAAAVALATVLPFAVWNLSALYEGTVGYVGRLPARPDALTLPNWAMHQLGAPAWPGLAFPLAALVVGVAAWRLRNSVAGFAAAAALTYGVFFAFNKFAFANYWFLVTGLAALAAAAALQEDATPAPATAAETVTT